MDTEIKNETSLKDEKTAEFLEKLYKNVKMGSESLIALMPKAKDQKLRTDMSVQLGKYEKFATSISKALFDLGREPKEENIVTKASAKIGIAMNTIIDSTSSHLAQMITEGSNMGIDSTIKQLREYENQPVSEQSMKIAREFIEFEEKNVETMRAYL